MGRSKQLTDEQYIEQLVNFQHNLLNADSFADYIKLHGIERAIGFYDALQAFQKLIEECAIERTCPNAMGGLTIVSNSGTILSRKMSFLNDNTDNVCRWAKEDLEKWQNDSQRPKPDSLKS